jgi:hypothetical protein
MPRPASGTPLGYHVSAMVASRKPGARGERRPNETLKDMFQRLLNDPSDDMKPLNFTLGEARYVGRRIYETGDPSEPTGEEVMRDFYGDWSEDDLGQDSE